MPVQRWDDSAGDCAAEELRQQTNKRLTLNLLIQGAAAHTFLTAHHLVRDELEAIRPGLTHLYDRFVISANLGYWMGDLVLLYGPPSRFWRRTYCPGHPFHQHRLLAKFGRELALASKRYLVVRGRTKGVIGIPILHYFQMIWLTIRVAWVERRERLRLTELAKRATSLVWDIPEGRLDAEFTLSMRFGNLTAPNTVRGRFLQKYAAGWGGVERQGRQFRVIAKSVFWPLIAHELTKGVAELICLHGLNALDDETYARVIEEADLIEHELWMLQAGPELWRRLLAVLPASRPLAAMLMHIARLAPEPLEELMLDVIQYPFIARDRLERLGE